MSTQPKSFKQKVYHEVKSVALITLYFAIWLGILMFLKKMILSEYKVEFSNISMALIGALILGKVVLIIDHIPLSRWTRERSAIYFIFFRTLLSIVAVIVLLMLEEAVHARHEYESFRTAFHQVLLHSDVYHLWANVTVVSISVFWFNVIFVIRKHVGTQKLVHLFFSVPMNEVLSRQTETENTNH